MRAAILHSLCLAALGLCGLSSAARAQAMDDFSVSAVRGIEIANGTSEGAFSISSTGVSFQGAATQGDFASPFLLADMLANPAGSGTETLNYPNGTNGLQAGFSLALYLPQSQMPGTAQLITLSGANALTASFTQANGETRFTASGTDVEAVDGALVTWQLSGTILAASGDVPETMTATTAINEVLTDSSVYPAGDYTWTGKFSAVLLPEPGSLALAGAAAIAFLAARCGSARQRGSLARN